MNSGNGDSRRIVFWILQALYTLILAGGGVYLASQNDRIKRLEDFRESLALEVNTIKWDVRGVRSDLCRTEGKVDDLTEWVTKRRVSRTPCD